MWDLSNKDDVKAITDNVTEVLNRNGPAFPFGYVGKVKSLQFAADNHMFAVMDGAFPDGRKARLRYRIKLFPERSHWIVKSYVELGKGKCTEDCSKNCIVLSSFPFVSLFEEAAVEYRKTRCPKTHPDKPVMSRRIVCDLVADVYIFCKEGNDEVDCCHYRLGQDEYDCWRVVEWECPKK